MAVEPTCSTSPVSHVRRSGWSRSRSLMPRTAQAGSWSTTTMDSVAHPGHDSLRSRSSSSMRLDLGHRPGLSRSRGGWGLSSRRRSDGAREPGGGTGPAAAARSPSASLDHPRNPEQRSVAPTRGETHLITRRQVCPAMSSEHRPLAGRLPPGAGRCPDPALLGEGQAAAGLARETGSWSSVWGARWWAGSRAGGLASTARSRAARLGRRSVRRAGGGARGRQ